MKTIPVECIVSNNEIALRYGVWPSAISNWRARHADFPKPFKTVGHRIPLFDVREVDAWARPRGYFPL